MCSSYWQTRGGGWWGKEVKKQVHAEIIFVYNQDCNVFSSLIIMPFRARHGTMTCILLKYSLQWSIDPNLNINMTLN